MPGKLSTHALDTLHGCPAAGLRLQLFRLEEDGSRALLKETTTNADGRTDAPLLGPGEIAPGRYGIIFHVGAYFARKNVDLPQPAFLEEVPVRFGIADAEISYHVPLLFSPWSYTTYRGS